MSDNPDYEDVLGHLRMHDAHRLMDEVDNFQADFAAMTGHTAYANRHSVRDDKVVQFGPRP